MKILSSLATTATYYYLLLKPSRFSTFTSAYRSFGFSTSRSPLSRVYSQQIVTMKSVLVTVSTSSNGIISSRSSARLKAAKRNSTTDISTETTPNSIQPLTPKPVKRRRVVVTPPASTTTVKSERTESSSEIVTVTKVPDSEFEDLEVSPEELRPSTTLTTGQCFHWKVISSSPANPLFITPTKAKDAPQKSAWGTHNETEWIGCLRVSPELSVVVVIRETHDTTLYRVLSDVPSSFDVKMFLRRYFQLEEPLLPLYNEWKERDARLGRIAACIPGVRILNQDPWECLASFICSSNNNIPRITKILQSIRATYGKKIMDADPAKGIEETIYSFPSLEELQNQATDEDLRKNCGIGYRAKYIIETMELLSSLGGEHHLLDIKEGSANGTLSPVEVQEKLIRFSGVGRKVADCVALFSLKQAGAIPVDVHVWNIACRDYDDDGKLKLAKSLTPTIYREVGELFRSRFVNKAGWAHSLLFVAELPSFRPVLPQDILDEMDKFRDEEQARKKAAKKEKESS